jgi:hypothetical protein
MKPILKAWKIAYGLAVLALSVYALSRYPSAAARYASWWSGGLRLDPFDGRLLKPVVVYAYERSGSELKVLVLRTYAEPAAQDITVKLTVFNADGSLSFYMFKERAPPGRLAAYTVHAPLAVGLRVEVEVDGARAVEERWLGGS